MDQENRIITFMNPTSPYVEAYKKLQLDIQLSSVDKPIKVIQVTSSQASEGKTSTAVNLAAVYALKNKRVLVIDMDFRKPRIHHVLDIKNEKGIIDVLADETTFKDVCYHHESGVDFLLRGSKTSKIEVTLESERLAKFLEELKEEYDVIILDCPPEMIATDACLISRLSDGVIFVVAHNKSKKDYVKESIKRLKTAKANILGVVMTQSDSSMGKRYSNYYYYDNYRDDDSFEEGGN